MKTAWLKKRATTLRLALTYLLVIMFMSISFSGIFYVTSMSSLHIQTGRVGSDGRLVTVEPQEELASRLQQNVDTIRHDLAAKLLGLIVTSLVFGSFFSYYLARRTLKPIESSVEAQTRFISDASHELRTPLTILQTEMDVALRKPHLTVGRARDALRNGRSTVLQMKGLTEGLLQLAQASQDMGELTPIPLHEVVKEAIRRVHTLAEMKQIAITNEVPALYAHGYPQHVGQVLTILLDNAIKYSSKKSPITVRGTANSKWISIEVIDQGPGISKEDLPHIFERFYRARQQTLHKETGGYGLGLSIALTIATQHRGLLTVESDINRGSTFTLKLPSRL